MRQWAVGGLSRAGRLAAPGQIAGAVVWMTVGLAGLSLSSSPSGLRPPQGLEAGGLTETRAGLSPDCSRRESRSQGCHGVSISLAMNLEPPKAEFRSATRVVGGPVTPRKGPPKFKQRQTRQFKSKPPKKGVQG